MAFKMSSREPLLPNTDEENNFYDRTHLLELPNARSTVRFRGPTAGTRLQIARTVNLCLSFFGLGLCFAIPNPTLEDLRIRVNTDTDSIYYIYTARSCGYLLGAIAGGVLFDRYNRQFLLFLSHLATAVGILVMPFCNELGVLMACTAITGVTMAFLDTGGNVWCLDLWGRKSAPVLQTLHFCFGLGAFVAPLVADPFLSPHGFHQQQMIVGGYAINHSNVTTGIMIPPVGIHIPHPRFNSHSISHRILPDSPPHPGERSANWEENPDGASLSFPIAKRSVPNTDDDDYTLYEKSSDRVNGSVNGVVVNVNLDSALLFPNQTESATGNDSLTVKTNGWLKLTELSSSSSTTESVPSSTPKHRLKPAVIDSDLLHKEHHDKWERQPKMKAHVAAAQYTKKVTSSVAAVTTSTANETDTVVPVDDNNQTVSDNSAMNVSSEDDNVTLNAPLSLQNVPTISIPSEHLSSTIAASVRPQDTQNAMTTTMTLSTPIQITVLPTVTSSKLPPRKVSEKMDITTSIPPLLILSSTSTHSASPENNLIERKTLEPPETTFISEQAATSSLMTEQLEGGSTTDFATDGSGKLPSISEPSVVLLTVSTTTAKPGPVHRVKDATSHAEKDDDLSAEWPTNVDSDPEPVEIMMSTKGTVTSLNYDSNDTHSENTSHLFISRGEDFFTRLYRSINRRRLGKFEFVYVILASYIFMVAIVFLVFLCMNPREPRSKQEEETDRSRPVGRTFVVGMVVLLSLFLCLYTGIEVAVGQLLQTFATKEQLRLPWSKAYFLPKLFWGSFAFARFVSILLALKLRGFTMLVADMVICLAASVLLVAGADKEEALLWVGVVILGLGLSSVFPTSIVWVERYVHVTNKAAATLILGTAVGEIAVPLVINRFINREPMVLMYTTLVVSVLCFVTFLGIWRMALRYGEKYSSKPDRCLYQLANADDVDDVLEMAPAFPNNQPSSWQPALKRKLERT